MSRLFQFTIRATMLSTLALLQPCALFASDVRMLPVPLPHNPGNVFVAGAEVKIPIPNVVGKWEAVDVDGAIVASGEVAGGGVNLGRLPTGHYRVNNMGRQVATAAVLTPLKVAVPADSPICLHTWLSGNYILKRIDSIEDAASLAALAGVNSIRDSVAWTWQQDAEGRWRNDGSRGVESFSLLMSASRRFGLDLLMLCEPSTPAAFALPPDWGVGVSAKFPADLRDYARFVKDIVGRSGPQVSAWEAWNEPESIGGMHLGGEVASAMKVFALAARSVRAGLSTGMGMGHVPAEALDRSGYLAAVSSYNYHGHNASPAYHAQIRRDLDRYSDDRPVWLTEGSYGAYPVEPDGSELTAVAERQQARDIVKFYARGINDGNARLYYFSFIQFGETAGKQWGVVRARSLQPRLGYLSLAAAGRLLAGAKPAGELLSLPNGVEGYAFSARPDGVDRAVAVVWSEGSAVWPVPPGAQIFDLWGRQVERREALTLGPDPVFCVSPASGAGAWRRGPARLIPPKPVAPTVCPVVADFRQPERLKNRTGGFFLITQEAPSLSIDVYNFADRPMAGTWRADAVEGFLAEIVQPGNLPPGARGELRITLKPTRPWTPELAKAPRWLTLRGDYGMDGESVLGIPFVNCPSDVAPGRLVAVSGMTDSARWRNHAAPGTTVRIDTDTKRIRLEIALGEPQNKTIGTAWAAPYYTLRHDEFPSNDVWGVSLNVVKEKGAAGQALALNLIKRNGAAWTCPLPFDMKQITEQDGQRLTLPLSWFARITHRAPDSSMELRPEEIVGIEVELVGRPQSAAALVVSDLNWLGGTRR